MISAIYANNKYLFSSNEISRNIGKISYLAIPIIASSLLPTVSGGWASYLACVTTCPAMALAAPFPLLGYTFEACMNSCIWMLYPTCP